MSTNLMHCIRRSERRGFTLVELMTVIAIVGALAALGVMGVSRYLKAAKTSEAKNSVGRIARSAAESFIRETAAAEFVAPGNESSQSVHQLCDDAVAVPTVVPQGKKYVPSNLPSSDFQAGTSTSGWLCLRFTMHDATHYQYDYQRDSTNYCNQYGCPVATHASNFEAAAIGDLDGDGTYSAFILNGEIDSATNQLNRATAVHIANEYE